MNKWFKIILIGLSVMTALGAAVTAEPQPFVPLHWTDGDVGTSNPAASPTGKTVIFYKEGKLNHTLTAVVGKNVGDPAANPDFNNWYVINTYNNINIPIDYFPANYYVAIPTDPASGYGAAPIKFFYLPGYGYRLLTGAEKLNLIKGAGPPTLGSLSPNVGLQGAAGLTVKIYCQNKVWPDGEVVTNQVHFTGGITVSSATILNNVIIAAISIPVTAPGAQQVTVDNLFGSLPFTVLAAGTPALISLNPDRGDVGTNPKIKITAVNAPWQPGAAASLPVGNDISFGPGIDIFNWSCPAINELDVDLLINSDATLGPRDVTINGLEGKLTFIVESNIPAPTGLQSTVNNSNSATLSWVPPVFQGEISGYDISYGDLPEANQNEILNAPSPYPLSGLTGGKTYYWKVRAKTAGQNGKWSETASFTTPPDIQINAPVSEEKIAAGSDYTIKWTNSLQITSVRVTYSKDDFKTEKVIADTVETGLAAQNSCPWPVPNDTGDTVRIKITDKSNPLTFAISEPFSITPPEGLTIVTTELKNGVVGQAYPNDKLTATGGAGGNQWSVVGTLPDELNWLTINPDGTAIAKGLPSDIIATSFTVKVTDKFGASASGQVSIKVLPPQGVGPVIQLYSLLAGFAPQPGVPGRPTTVIVEARSGPSPDQATTVVAACTIPLDTVATGNNNGSWVINPAWGGDPQGHYLVIKHKLPGGAEGNHLPVITSNKIVLQPQPEVNKINLSYKPEEANNVPLTAVYSPDGKVPALRVLDDGSKALRAGYLESTDKLIDVSDYSVWKGAVQKAGVSGQVDNNDPVSIRSDINGDNLIDVSDYSCWKGTVKDFAPDGAPQTTDHIYVP